MIDPNDKETGKHADEIDQANAVSEFLAKRQVELIRDKAAPEQHYRFDGVHCIDRDCGVAIPEARLALGKIRCIDCQTVLEKQIRR